MIVPRRAKTERTERSAYITRMRSTAERSTPPEGYAAEWLAAHLDDVPEGQWTSLVFGAEWRHANARRDAFDAVWGEQWGVCWAMEQALREWLADRA